MRLTLAILAFFVLGAGAAAPAAAAPLNAGALPALWPGDAAARLQGGRYRGDFVQLWLNNDGRSVSSRSYVRGAVECGGARFTLFAERGTAVAPDGSFRWGPVRGRFSPDGRSVSGTVGCAAFTARRVGPGVGCDAAVDRKGAWRLETLERGTGCTAAQRLADRWAASPRCLPARRCVVARHRCRSARGGRLTRFATAVCTRRGSRVELVRLRLCFNDGGSVAAYANFPCVAARPAITRWYRDCRVRSCRVGRWRCTGGLGGRCLDARRRHLELVFRPITD